MWLWSSLCPAISLQVHRSEGRNLTDTICRLPCPRGSHPSSTNVPATKRRFRHRCCLDHYHYRLLSRRLTVPSFLSRGSPLTQQTQSSESILDYEADLSYWQPVSILSKRHVTFFSLCESQSEPRHGASPTPMATECRTSQALTAGRATKLAPTRRFCTILRIHRSRASASPFSRSTAGPTSTLVTWRSSARRPAAPRRYRSDCGT